MLCQRCGLCCTTMPVVINVDGRAKAKPGDAMCPYLSFDGTKASCAVHDKPWFKRSACHIYGNSHIDPDFLHKRGKPCLVGEQIQQHGGLLAVRPSLQHIALDDLEDICKWEPEI